MDLKNFTSAISQLVEEKEIPKNKVVEAIEAAIAAAYKKDYGEKGQLIKAKLDQKTGDVEFWQVKIVVDESMILTEEELEEIQDHLEKESDEDEEDRKFRFNPERHIYLDEARKIKKDVEVGEEIEIELEPKKSFGRIAAQTAKQVVLQKIKEIERNIIIEEFKSKEGEIVSGIVQRIEGPNVYVDIGKTLGVLSKEEQTPGEFYRPGQRLKTYLLKVEETTRGPVIFLSRSFPRLITKLFELEAPEVSSGTVEIKAIAREAGSRSKVAVYSEAEGIDPIGAVVGQKGTRVTAVISELGGEKVDIVEYDPQPEKFIANALSPAKVIEVKLIEKGRALVTVPDEQLSLGIGKDGQNVRLAAKLTGWKIDVEGLESGEIKPQEDSEGTDDAEIETEPEEKNEE